MSNENYELICDKIASVETGNSCFNGGDYTRITLPTLGIVKVRKHATNVVIEPHIGIDGEFVDEFVELLQKAATPKTKKQPIAQKAKKVKEQADG